MTSESRWKLVSQFLLRRAGFPFGVLEALGAPAVLAASERVVKAHARAREARAALLGHAFSSEVKRLAELGERRALHALSGWRRRVGRWRAAAAPEGSWAPELLALHETWRSAVADEAQARVAVERALEAEQPRIRLALRRFFQEPAAHEALFLLAPDLMETMAAPLARAPSAAPDAAERAFERRLYAFAQRLASKNETTSFFGPLTYGEVAGEGEGVSFGPEHPSGVVKREAFFAFWAAAALAKTASSRPAIRQALAVRRVPVSSAVRRGEYVEAWGPRGRPEELPERTSTVFFAVDDVRTVAGLAAHCELPEAVIETEVRKLERLGLVRRLLEPRSTTARPLEDLAGHLPPGPEGEAWRQVLARFDAHLRAFEKAGLAERPGILRAAEASFTETTGLPARRSAGQTYADRTLLYEDCLGDLQPMRMGLPAAARLEEALAPAMRLAASYGHLRHQAVRLLASEVVSALPAPVPFLSFAAALDARITQGALRAFDGRPRSLLQSLEARVARAAEGGRVARLTAATLRELAPERGPGRFASPDVMLARRPDGSLLYVLGEVHPYVFAWGSQGHFAPDRERFLAPFREDLGPWGGPARIATVLRRRRHKGLVSDAFPGLFIEISGRSVDDPGRRVAIADLHVVLGAQGPQLMGPHGPLTLYSGEDDHPHLRVFAPPPVELPPVRLGAHTPRIEVGDCVLQRERWELAEGDHSALVHARTAAALAVEVAALRESLQLPRWLFAMSPTEVKPLCIDLASPLAQAHLQRLLSLGRLGISEMLPGPEELWLARRAGPHTSELRLAMVREA